MSTSFDFPLNPTLDEIVILPDGSEAQWNGYAWIPFSTGPDIEYPITIDKGGTGAINEAMALTNLGGTSVGIGVFTAINQAAAQAVLGISKTTGERIIPDGTIADPGLAFASESTLGMYKVAAGIIGFSSEVRVATDLNVGGALGVTGTGYVAGAFTSGASIQSNSNTGFIANSYADWGAPTVGINVFSANPAWNPLLFQALHVQGSWAGFRMAAGIEGAGTIDFSISGTAFLDMHGGSVTAATFNGNLNGTATSANNVGGYVPTWSDPGGIPAYLWGSDNPNSTMYLVPPGRLSVNYANSAGSAPANGGTASNVSSLEGAAGGTIHSPVTVNATLTTNAVGVGLSVQGWNVSGAVNFNNFLDINPSYGFTLSAQHQPGAFAGLSWQLGGTEMFRFRSDGYGSALSNWNSFSDASLKDNLQPIINATEKLKMLTGYTYTRNDIPVAPWSPADKRYVGLLGQDAQIALPESTQIDEKGLILLEYSAITTLLVNAVKEIEARLTAIGA
jgi:Chaperone of endosialidase